jgi:hypothetical protein
MLQTNVYLHTEKMIKKCTLGTNCKSLSGTDIVDGFAPRHRTLQLDNGRKETS